MVALTYIDFVFAIIIIYILKFKEYNIDYPTLILIYFGTFDIFHTMN